MVASRSNKTRKSRISDIYIWHCLTLCRNCLIYNRYFGR
jgi:hypothetical protein